VRSRQEATSHWRRDIKTPALHEINHETTKRNNYSSDNQFKNVGIMKAEETINIRAIHWKLPGKTEKRYVPN